MTQSSDPRRKLTLILSALAVAVALAIAALMVYQLVTFRRSTVQSLAALADVLANHGSVAVAEGNQTNAAKAVASIQAEPRAYAAALYDRTGKLLAVYPASGTPFFANILRPDGNFFENGELLLFRPVFHEGVRVGTVALRADLRMYYRLLLVYAALSALILLGSAILALAIANGMRRRMSKPILALAGTARKISEQSDLSLRAPDLDDLEIGTLGQAFNQMLARIEEQTAALQRSEATLRLALQSAHAGVWDWNVVSGQVSADEYLYAMRGLKPEERTASAERALDTVHPEDREAAREAILKAVQEKREFVHEFRRLWPDGSVHYMFARGKPFYDETGKPIRVIGVSQDITERKQAERELQESRARFSGIIRSAMDAIISVDANQRIILFNGAAEKMFGAKAADALGQPLDHFIPERFRKAHHEYVEQFVRSGATRRAEAHLQPLTGLRASGEEFPMEASISHVDAGGQSISTVIIRDITERVAAQAELEQKEHQLREQAQMIDLAHVMACDLEDRIIFWTSGMERLYGYSRAEAVGRIAHELLQTRFAEPLPFARSTLMRQGQWEGELVHTRKNGSQLTVASRWVLYKDHHGNPTAILAVNTDITERKHSETGMIRLNVELERRVRERTAELTAANQELEAFIYSVAHDLRAPLRHMDAFTRIVAEEFSPGLPSEARMYLDNIHKSNQNMSRLVDDLLNLARVGRQELKRQPIRLDPIVHEVIAEMRTETEGRRIEWQLHPLPIVEGDPGLVRQVFVNLLSNAVKYTRPRERAVIEVGLQNINNEPVLYVHDNGVGFNMKYADKLFGVFQRLHRADEFEGTGVGLATVERIIRKHGGRIWAESAPDQGATFFFTLHPVRLEEKTVAE